MDQNGWFIMDDLGVPLFLETPKYALIFLNTSCFRDPGWFEYRWIFGPLLSRPRSLRKTNDHRLNQKNELLRNQNMAEVFSVSWICIYNIYIYICLYMYIYIYSWLCPFIYSKIPCGHGSRMVYRGGTKETNGVDGATFWVCRVRGWLVNPCSKWRTGSSSGNHGHLFLEGNGCLLRLIFQGWLQGWLLLHAQPDFLDVVQKNVGKHPRSYWVAMFFQDLIIWLIDVCDLNMIKSNFTMFCLKKFQQPCYKSLRKDVEVSPFGIWVH